MEEEGRVENVDDQADLLGGTDGLSTAPVMQPKSANLNRMLRIGLVIIVVLAITSVVVVAAVGQSSEIGQSTSSSQSNSGGSSPPPPAPISNAPSPSPTSGGERLVWSDEFDNCPGGRPDPVNWGYEHGFVRNNELQWYTNSNANCTDGKLIITAERVTPDHKTGNAGYYSSSIRTDLGSSNPQFQYGRFEMYGKIDIRMGSWPAFWLLGQDTAQYGWPKCGEIDIMEFYKGKTLFNVMYANNNGGTVWSSKTLTVNAAWASQFHNWTMTWSNTSIGLYLDSVLMNSFNVETASASTFFPNPFRQPMFIILNQAIGGNAGGDPSGTTFPVLYEVDYVRFYQYFP